MSAFAVCGVLHRLMTGRRRRSRGLTPSDAGTAPDVRAGTGPTTA